MNGYWHQGGEREQSDFTLCFRENRTRLVFAKKNKDKVKNDCVKRGAKFLMDLKAEKVKNRVW